MTVLHNIKCFGWLYYVYLQLTPNANRPGSPDQQQHHNYQPSSSSHNGAVSSSSHAPPATLTSVKRTTSILAAFSILVIQYITKHGGIIGDCTMCTPCHVLQT